LAAIHNYGGSISIWDADGNLLRTIDRAETLGPYVGPIAFLPGSHVLVGPAPTSEPGREPNIPVTWNVDAGQIERLVPNPAVDGDFQGNRPGEILVSPDGAYVAASPVGGAIAIYSTKDWRQIGTEQLTHSMIPIANPSDRTPPKLGRVDLVARVVSREPIGDWCVQRRGAHAAADFAINC
jgi:hypothetical protein